MRFETPAVASSQRTPDVHGLARLELDTCILLAARLRAASWDDQLVAACEAIVPGQLDAVRLPVIAAWLSRREGAGPALASLFAYDATVSRAVIEGALGEDLTASLLRARVLVESESGIRSEFRVMPFRGLYILCDRPDAGPDAVMGGGPTTAAIARFVPECAGSVLDLGCGAGLIALYAAKRGAVRPVGTDVNDRAILLARFNARLNGLEVEFHSGDLVEPMRGSRFDLVLAQPPYVPLPEGIAAATYLHGGRGGDELPRRFARAIASVLAPGGIGVVGIEAPASGASIHEMLGAAVNYDELDVVTLSSPGMALDQQAVAYASIVDPSLGATYRDAARRYADHLVSLGETPRRAVTVLRRRGPSSAPLDLHVEVPNVQRVTAASLHAYLRGLELSRLDDSQLLRAELGIPAGTRVLAERTSGALRSPPRYSVRFAPGAIATDHEISEAGSVLFEILERGGTLEEAVHRFANACDETPHTVRPIVLGFAREGLTKGMLVPWTNSVETPN